MIAKEYHKLLEKELGQAKYLLLTILVGTLQLLRQVKLELLVVCGVNKVTILRGAGERNGSLISAA